MNRNNDNTIIWLLVVGAVVWSFKETSVQTTLARIFIVLCCFPIHECAHAWTAKKFGDSTAFFRGRVSLNPFDHLDPFGTFLIFAFGFGYAKPVPVTVSNFPYQKRKLYYMYTSLAGPASNLILALIFMIIMRFMLKAGVTSQGVLTFFATAAMINISLAIFNLLPIPPLDGASIWGIILPGNTYFKTAKFQQIAIAAIFLGSFLLHRIGVSPLSFLSGKVYTGLWKLTGLI